MFGEIELVSPRFCQVGYIMNAAKNIQQYPDAVWKHGPLCKDWYITSCSESELISGHFIPIEHDPGRGQENKEANVIFPAAGTDSGRSCGTMALPFVRSVMGKATRPCMAEHHVHK
jgi:hypothetical protein